MSQLAVVSLVVALVAAIFMFGGIAASAMAMAQALFAGSIVLAMTSLTAGLTRGQ